MIIFPARTVTNWWRRRGHELLPEDLDEVLADLPERLVVGTGAEARMRPDQATLSRLKARGIAVEILPTPAAVRRYRELDPRRTAAAHVLSSSA